MQAGLFGDGIRNVHGLIDIENVDFAEDLVKLGVVHGFLIFANLYSVHDYYFYASAFPLLIALAIVLVGLIRDERVPRIVPGLQLLRRAH